MDGYQIVGNTSHGSSIQINAPVTVNAVRRLEPSFFKTSEYEQHKNINPKRVPETCLWFLEHPTFQRWKASSCNDLLWLSADPGCGKSVLSRALIDEKLVGEESDNICYFFFKDNEEQDNAVVTLCSLLHQIFCWRDDLLHRHATRAVKRCGEALTKDLGELWRTFESVASDPTIGEVVCILDALDECRESDRNRLIQYLEDFYTRSVNVATQTHRVKFLVTSRPYGEIERKFGRLTRNIPTIRLAGEDESEKISREIEIVIKSKSKEIAETCNLTERVQSCLEARLGDTPNRTYLWLHLTWKEVESQITKNGRTEKRLLATINTLPNSVEDAYERILAKCDAGEARKTLQIIVAARRPLTLEELDLAMEIEPESTSYDDLDCQGSDRRDSIRENCGLLVSVVDSRVYLIHQTAREFLIRKSSTVTGPYQWKESIDLRECNRILSTKCVTYLLFQEFKQYPATKLERGRLYDYMYEDDDHKLLDYAAKHWVSHVHDTDDMDPALVTRMTELCNIGNGSSCAWAHLYAAAHFYASHESFSVSRDPSEPRYYRSKLDWAVTLGLLGATGHLLTIMGTGSSEREDINSAFLRAIERGTLAASLVTLMLEMRGSDIEITQDILFAAVGNKINGKDIVTLLLDRRYTDVHITRNVISEATRNEISGMTIVELLLGRCSITFHVIQEITSANIQTEAWKNSLKTLLLDSCKRDNQLLQAAVIAIIHYLELGPETRPLSRLVEDFQITEEVVIDYIKSNRSIPVISLLLEYRKADVSITENVFREVLKTGPYFKSLWAVFVKYKNDEMVEKLTEDTLYNDTVEILSKNLRRMKVNGDWIYFKQRDI